MDFILKVVTYTLDYINSVPASSWAALGTLVAGSAIVTAVVAWINRRRAKKELEKLGKAMVTWVVMFLSGIVSILDFIINNGATFGAFLPYWAEHTAQVIAISTLIYNFAKPSLKWFQDRKAGTPITNQNYTPPMLTESQSFGTTSAGIAQPQLVAAQEIVNSRTTDMLR